MLIASIQNYRRCGMRGSPPSLDGLEQPAFARALKEDALFHLAPFFNLISSRSVRAINRLNEPAQPTSSIGLA